MGYTPTPDAIERITAPGKTPAEKAKLLMNAVANATSLREGLDKLAKEQQALTSAYNVEREAIFQRERALLKTCSHVDLKYYPDASGNNDSSYVCQICQIDFGRYPPKRGQ